MRSHNTLFLCSVLRVSSVELIGPESYSGEFLLQTFRFRFSAVSMNQGFCLLFSVQMAAMWQEGQLMELCTSGMS